MIQAVVVGTGFIGVAHVEALRRLGIHVRGVVGSTPERARVKAEAAGLGPVYESHEEMLADPEVRAVHVTSPNSAHHAQVLAALAAGKHVICEKPLGMTSAETADMVAAAGAAGLVNAVCFNTRFYGISRRARALVAAGEIGRVLRVTGSYLQDWLLLPTDWNWRLDPAVSGESRAMADIGSHWLDLASFVSGLRVEAVLADLHTAVPVRRRPLGEVETFAAAGGDVATVEQVIHNEDAAAVLLRYAGGARGVMHVSQVNAGRKNESSWEIAGSAGALAWNSQAPDELWIGRRGAPNGRVYREPGADGDGPVSDYPPGHVEGFPDTFKHLFRAAYADIAAGGPGAAPPYATFADGHRAVRLTEAILASARTEQWTTVEGSGS